MIRKEKLVTGEIYHIFNRSIANFEIFNSATEFLRMKNVIRYYQIKKPCLRFSLFIEPAIKQGFDNYLMSMAQGKEKLVNIVAYCIMPTHIHLILRQLKENGISIFTGNILNSYSRYFNTKHRRKGPLWEGKFKNILVKTDEQLLHLTRYIHLNPVTANLVNKPENWTTSSYREYLLELNNKEGVCCYNDILNINPISYRKFVEDRIAYQKELATIKGLLLDEVIP